ncbi:MAG: hypothetical protein ACRD2T_15345, partial [Thermoanaerobaculia bacterium]
AYPVAAATRWPEELRDALTRIETFVETSLREGQPLAQGTVEIGGVVVVFRVLPKGPTALPVSARKS